jgi:hypothetical protein
VDRGGAEAGADELSKSKRLVLAAGGFEAAAGVAWMLGASWKSSKSSTTLQPLISKMQKIALTIR